MFCWHNIFYLLGPISSNVCWMCGRNEIRINEDQRWMTKRRSRNEHHKRLSEIRNRTQQSLQTFISLYLLTKMLRNVGIILLVQFSKYLESFSMTWSGIRYIWHKQFGLVFIETHGRPQEFFLGATFELLVWWRTRVSKATDIVLLSALVPAIGECDAIPEPPAPISEPFDIM